MSRFETVSDEYLPVAQAALHYFRGCGYTVSKEKSKIGYPYVPALTAKHGSTTLIVEVGSRLLADRSREWMAYCKSMTSDNRLVFATKESDVPANDLTLFADGGIGLYAKNGDFHEILAPKDIAINLEFPNISDMSLKLRKMLRPTYEKVSRREPIEAFNEACIALEDAGRSYLLSRINQKVSPAVLISNGKIIALDQNRISKLTLGQLGKNFGFIAQMNYTDSLLARTIPAINADRILVAHKKQQNTAKLRLKAGQNIWAIVSALKAIG